MKRLAFLLLLLFLLAACHQTPAPPPPPRPAVDPPAESPVGWRYNDQYGELEFWMKDWAWNRIELANYTESLDGRWRMQWYGIPPNYSEGYPGSRQVQSLGGEEGYFIHYGLDTSDDRYFGGRKFMWKYRYRLNTDHDPWTFEAPVGPVSFQVLEEFPWEAQGLAVGKSPWRYSEGSRSLNTTALKGPLVGCLQQDHDRFRPRGIHVSAWAATAVQWHYLSVTDKGWSSTYNWAWKDGRFVGKESSTEPYMVLVTGLFPGGVEPGGNTHPLNNRANQYVMVVAAQGKGPWPHPWERRFFRLAGRGFGGYENPDGSVRCERGEWQLDEITDPELVARFTDAMDRAVQGWKLGEPIPPGLLPPGW